MSRGRAQASIRKRKVWTGIDAETMEMTYDELNELAALALSSDDFGVGFECEFEHPPSWAGRKVLVRIQPEMVVPIMKCLREYAIDQAIDQRKQTLAQAEVAGDR